jgi:hypothetical protein
MNLDTRQLSLQKIKKLVVKPAGILIEFEDGTLLTIVGRDEEWTFSQEQASPPSGPAVDHCI